MKLLVQPDDGPSTLVSAIRHARESIHIVVFRLDLRDVEEALKAAVERGVVVNALVAHTNHGGERRLRKLEERLLESGVSVARTDDELVRYHGKMLIVDDTLFVLGFNYTRLDIERSRSFGLVTKDARLHKAATALFESDLTRQPFVPTDDRLVVSPENAREVLTDFLRDAERSLYIYDVGLSDPRILKVLRERVQAGVDVRVIGKMKQLPEGIGLRKLGKPRLHARAVIRDGGKVFIGSQSFKRAELDKRREVGVLVTDSDVAQRLQEVFESDWESAKPRQEPEAAGREEEASESASGE